eukprot:6175667-Pleurochrysis_carterae.AAC.2
MLEKHYVPSLPERRGRFSERTDSSLHRCRRQARSRFSLVACAGIPPKPPLAPRRDSPCGQ